MGPGQQAYSDTTATLWGLAGWLPMVGLLLLPSAQTEEFSPSLLLFALFTTALLEFVAVSSKELRLQRTSSAVVLFAFLSPELPLRAGPMCAILGQMVLLFMLPLNRRNLAESGRSLVPLALAGLLVFVGLGEGRSQQFFALEVFVVASLVTRCLYFPFQQDIFLTLSLPAVALGLVEFGSSSLTSTMLAVPLLLLLTSIRSDAILLTLRLRQALKSTREGLDKMKWQAKVSRWESRQRGVLLDRREQQLEVLDSLSGRLEEATDVDPLCEFLVEQSLEVTGAEGGIVYLRHEVRGWEARYVCLHGKRCSSREAPPVPRPPQQVERIEGPLFQAGAWASFRSHLVAPLGEVGFLYFGRREGEPFPGFLEEFFAVFTRQGGAALLALTRLADLRYSNASIAAANEKLQALLDTVDRSLSLEAGHGFEQAILEGAGRLTGAQNVEFSDDLSGVLLGGNRYRCDADQRGQLLAYSFEANRPAGILCRNPADKPFNPSQVEWLGVLVSFAETLIENHRLHEQVSASLQQLKESQTQMVRSSQWAAAGRLAANAAHELNTPLGAIKLSAETAASFIKSGPQPALESLNLILRSVDRCKRVTERLLVYSKPRTEPVREPFRIGAVVEDSLSSVRPFLKSKNISVEVSLNPELEVRGDSQDCYWAITNVLKNGIDALEEPQQKRKEIRISGQHRGDFLYLKLDDSGPGVAPELAEKIFEPFFSTKKIGAGNGLGLAISRRNVRSWDGDIFLTESELGGACFVLKIPSASSSITKLRGS